MYHFTKGISFGTYSFWGGFYDHLTEETWAPNINISNVLISTKKRCMNWSFPRSTSECKWRNLSQGAELLAQIVINFYIKGRGLKEGDLLLGSGKWIGWVGAIQWDLGGARQRHVDGVIGQNKNHGRSLVPLYFLSLNLSRWEPWTVHFDVWSHEQRHYGTGWRSMEDTWVRILPELQGVIIHPIQ